MEDVLIDRSVRRRNREGDGLGLAACGRPRNAIKACRHDEYQDGRQSYPALDTLFDPDRHVPIEVSMRRTVGIAVVSDIVFKVFKKPRL